LAAAAEVMDAVAADGGFEQTQVGGYRGGDGLVRAGAQHQPPPFRPLPAQPVEEGRLVRQAGGVQPHLPEHPRLEPGAAAQQPERQQQHLQRVLLEQGQAGLDQGVAADQGAVQVHAQRRRGGGGVAVHAEASCGNGAPISSSASIASAPSATANHKVARRQTTVAVRAAAALAPARPSSRLIAASAPPRPPGMNEAAPASTASEYAPTEPTSPSGMSRACTSRYRPTPSAPQASRPSTRPKARRGRVNRLAASARLRARNSSARAGRPPRRAAAACRRVCAEGRDTSTASTATTAKKPAANQAPWRSRLSQSKASRATTIRSSRRSTSSTAAVWA